MDRAVPRLDRLADHPHEEAAQHRRGEDHDRDGDVVRGAVGVEQQQPAERSATITPPTASAPWLTMNASATNRPKASRISSRPAALIGSWARPKRAMISDTPPSAPGRIAPGWKSSKPIPTRPEREQQEDRARVHEQLEHLELERHVVRLDPRAGRVQRLALRALDLEAVELARPAPAASAAIDVDRGCGAGASAAGTFVARRTVCAARSRVAAVALRKRAHIRGGVVADLAAEHLVLVSAAERDRRRRADVRLRCHRRHVRRLGDVHAGRRGARAVRARRRRRPASARR